jgi:putative transposase
LGGRRGRLISASDRKNAIELIDETVKAGAREKMACHELGISQRTLQRWREAETLQDQRQVVKRPVPKNKLTKEERAAIVAIANSDDSRSAFQIGQLALRVRLQVRPTLLPIYPKPQSCG